MVDNRTFVLAKRASERMKKLVSDVGNARGKAATLAERSPEQKEEIKKAYDLADDTEDELLAAIAVLEGAEW